MLRLINEVRGSAFCERLGMISQFRASVRLGAGMVLSKLCRALGALRPSPTPTRPRPPSFGHYRTRRKGGASSCRFTGLPSRRTSSAPWTRHRPPAPKGLTCWRRRCCSSGVVSSWSERCIGLAPIYQRPETAEEGGLAGYGPRIIQLYRDVFARQLVKLLQGVKPADLPIEQPTKFELVINLKTASALGITVPQSVLGLADEVIE
jgi:hypothetical protein